MKARRGISFLCIFIGLFLIVSVSYAQSNPELNSTNKGLAIALFDGNGNELPKDENSNFRLFHENNAYPGWEDSYTLQIKNTGSGVINYNLSLYYDEPEQQPDLAQVLTMTVQRGDIKASGKLSELNGEVLQQATTLYSQETHVFNITLAMDEEAGNEYQNLSLDVFLKIVAEQDTDHEDPSPTPTHTPEPTHTPKPTPKPTPTPSPTPEEPTPEPTPTSEPTSAPEPTSTPEPEPTQTPEPGPDDGTGTPIPGSGEDFDEDNGGISQNVDLDVLPKTGGMPYELFMAVGVVLIAIGCWLRKAKI